MPPLDYVWLPTLDSQMLLYYAFLTLLPGKLLTILQDPVSAPTL
jgi:hypothetical protein